MRRTLEKIRCKFDVIRPYTFNILSGLLAAVCLTVVLTQIKISMPQNTEEVTSYALLASTQQPNAMLALTGIQAGENDEIIHTGASTDGTNISISRSFLVDLSVDGETLTSEITEGTVGEILEKNGITLSENDIVSPSLDTPLARGMDITVNRVTFQETSKRAEVTDANLEDYKASLPASALSSFTKSKSRIYDVVYRETLVDGVVTDREMINLNAVYHPYDSASGGFQKGVAVSTIDEFDGITLGEDGLPTTYSRKISNAVTTAYSASAGRGAGGQGLYCGTVAVNPAVIPYGTRLFITSSDGGFVYGYAIASDTGTALQNGGGVDIDLYFESNAECYAFGKRSLDVYILD